MANPAINPVVWTEIPVTDLEASVAFYNTVFKANMKITTMGPNPMAFFPGADYFPGKGGISAGHFYPGTPPVKGTGPTIHFAVPDTLEETIERCKQAGGEVNENIVDLPTAKYVYATDLDGTSIGLFELK